MKQETDALAPRPPRVALAIATGFGLGYLPKAPGTWGSLGGVVLAWGFLKFCSSDMSLALGEPHLVIDSFYLKVIFALALALVGLWAAGRAATYLGSRDPQVVVIDEISGQSIALFLGAGGVKIQQTGGGALASPPSALFGHGVVNWKYLLLGFILFRVFDIWKPFPVRQAEGLPGGWGIMVDDWVASIYAALGLWLASTLGL